MFGAKDSRPALDEFMAAVRRGGISVVAVWKFDRFARSTQHLLQALQEFRARGVEFISLREAVDTSTAAGRMVFTFLAAVAEFEREIIVERVRAGVARAKALGKHCGRPRVDFDLRPALALMREGRSIRETAAILLVDRNTLRRRMREAATGGVVELALARYPVDPEGTPRVALRARGVTPETTAIYPDVLDEDMQDGVDGM